ncbi:MAG: SDR family NAD(P)-dependent oxidoreductase [Acidobacteriota bacterium]
MKLNGKTAIVTGGSAGIGLAIARRLGADGARVAICGRSADRLSRASQNLASSGIEVLAARCDVQDAQAVESLVEQVVGRFGAIHILVNNAGANEPTPLQEPDDTAWQQNIRTGLDGAYYCTSRVLRHMPDGGRLVYIASVTAKFGVPGAAGYCAAKHGLLGLVRSAALELAPRQITANAVCPGWVETDLARVVMQRVADRIDRDFAETRRRLLANVPLGEIIEPEEVAAMVAYLVSPEARNVTGQAYNLCGGQVMY